MASREDLHKLIDELPERETETALRFLQFLRQEGAKRGFPSEGRGLAEAPEDDEPDTEEERQASAAARQAFRRGETVSLDALKSQLGL